jgi:hypothetical protein
MALLGSAFICIRMKIWNIIGEGSSIWSMADTGELSTFQRCHLAITYDFSHSVLGAQRVHLGLNPCINEGN